MFFSFSYASFSAFDVEDSIVVIVPFFLITFILYLTCHFEKKSNYLNIFKNTIVGYFFLSYLIKSIILLNNFELIKNLRSLSQVSVNSHLLDAFSISLFFILGLMVIPGHFYFSKKGDNFRIDEQQPTSYHNFNIAFSICLLMLIIKIWVHYVLLLGIPGVQTQGIPIIGGVITYFVRMGGFALINILLFLSLEANNRAKIFCSLIICFLFCTIDLSIGVKYSFVYQLYMCFVLIMFSRNLSTKIKNNMTKGVSIFLVFFLLLYPYINYYRFALLSGKVGWDAIFDALGNEHAQSSSVFLELLNRIAGIENLIFALDKRSLLDASIFSLLNSEFSIKFTEAITGVSGAVNAVGATQVGLLSIIFKESYIAIFLTAILISVVLLSVVFFIIKAFGKSHYVLACSISAIFVTYILFGTGNLVFYIKELVVMLLSIKIYIYLVGISLRAKVCQSA